MIDRLFLSHPRSVGEGYFEHMRFAARFGLRLIRGGLACLLHAVFPWAHERTGSRLVFTLNAELKGRKPTAAELDGQALVWEI